MKDFITHVGMDTDSHGFDIAIAEGFGSSNTELRSWGRIPADLDSLDKLIKQLTKKGYSHLRFVYEAGPSGYTIYRHLQAKGIECLVVAPSTIPVKGSERVKTNRRDAIKLARLDRAGDLTGIYVPEEEDEAMRDVVRARAAAVAAATRLKQQIKSLLMRHGVRYTGQEKGSWGTRYREWLRALKFEHVARTYVLHEWLVALDEAEARVARLTSQIEELLPQWRMREVVSALQGLRGVALVTAVGMVAEVGDLTRFSNPRQLMGYLGLVPSEHSTGERRRLGSITKTGNSQARRSLVESAWSYSRPPRVTKVLKERHTGLSTQVIEISWRAQVRLSSRYRRLVGRGKNTRQSVVAVARELCAFMWAIARAVKEEQPQQPQKGSKVTAAARVTAAGRVAAA